MIRQIWNLIKLRKQAEKETGEISAGTVTDRYRFTGQYAWGQLEIELNVEQGVIQNASAGSDAESQELIGSIGDYLTGRKYERKEILKTLDIIPVNSEQENAIMRDVYNLLDEKIDQ